jgi:opacity protein-like surface antigen
MVDSWIEDLRPGGCMTRKWMPIVGIALAASLVPAAASAQGYLFLGGGGTFPSGTFGEFAETGWMVSLGGGIDVGPDGLSVAIEGFYGENKHTEGTAGVVEKTNPYGVLADLVFAIGDQSKIHPYVLGGLGFLIHKFTTNASGESGLSETQFAWSLGAGVSVPLGNTLALYGEGRYTGASDTQFFAAFLGLALFMGR